MNPKALKTVSVGVGGAAILTGLDKLIDPNQCAAFLSSHTGLISAAGAFLSMAALWIKSPNQG